MISDRRHSPIFEYILNKFIFLGLGVVFVVVIILVVPADGYLCLRPLHDLVRQLLEPVILLSGYGCGRLMRDTLELIDVLQLLQILSLIQIDHWSRIY